MPLLPETGAGSRPATAKRADFQDPKVLEMMTAMVRFNDELVKAGILNPKECAGLKPSSAGKRVAFEDADFQ